MSLRLPTHSGNRCQQWLMILVAITVFATSSTAAAQSCTPNPQSPSVTICQPASGATVASPVQVVAVTTDKTHPVTSMIVYIDNQIAYKANSNSVNTSLTIP